MIKKILIANRGEIACRIMRSAKELGISTVAIYSEVDKRALHVEMADEAFYVGEAPAVKSYLNIPNILKVIKNSKSDAVHPGYGFLSENSEFVEMLVENEVNFVGPPIKAISDMGDKITSKKIAREANVSTVPGHLGVINNLEQAKEIAASIGYPVMVKASAGGGGKGMRVVYSEKDLADSFEISKRESASSFGDDRVFLEKFVENPRHIEIQIIGDKFGNYAHLGERECSIQRRNQKVIEEAPSPFLDKELRTAMAQQAISLAKKVKYYSAGTVEFIVDSAKNFYFLEMNTRLQVEHPVTELITGIDIVKEMISIESGQKLSFSQDMVKFDGWAIESRVYAEDPSRNFLPSTGRITKLNSIENLKLKNGLVRNDTGVREGDRISLFYDPMLSKLCTWANDRKSAIEQMSIALDYYYVEGLKTNISFLSALCQDQDFLSGNIHTGLIAEKFPVGFSAQKLERDDLLNVISVMAALDMSEEIRNTNESYLLFGPLSLSAYLYYDNVQYEISSSGHSTFLIKFKDGIENTVMLFENCKLPIVKASVNNRDFVVKLQRINSIYYATFRGSELKCIILRSELVHLFELMPEKKKEENLKELKCPMPGLLVSLAVSNGEKVERGQALCIVEAMKMENVLYAEQPGIVKVINFSVGDTLSVDDKILEFE